MRSDKNLTAEQKEKRAKRLRFGGLVLLTVLVIAGVVTTALCVKSCDEKVNLDIGQPYDAGKAIVTVTDVYLKSIDQTDHLYAIITLRIDAEKDFTFDPEDAELDGVSPMSLSLSDVEEIGTDETQVAAGTSREIKIAFMVPRSMKVSFLTYKKAVIRLGSMIENDNNLS